jgi:hypothetical protein
MKNQVAVISVVLVYLLLSSCAKNDGNSLRFIEQKLPGKWNIESVTIPSWGSGIKYKGETFYHDTILYDIGSLEIPPFSTDLLDLNSKADSTYRCNLIIEGDTFNILIEHLFMSGSDYFVYFRQGYSDLFGTENQNAAFLSTSRLFNFNAYLFIINDNQIRIKRASGDDDYTVMLSK